jgi:hypothetical protein
MSVIGTAAAFASSQAAQTQAALATTVIKQNHQAEAGLVALIEQAVEAGKQAAGSPTAPGTGNVVDVKA